MLTEANDRWNKMALDIAWKEITFIQKAVKAGFTPTQAQFMYNQKQEEKRKGAL